MNILNFDYNKDGEVTNRKTLLLNKSKDYFDTIDLGHLDESEVEEVKKIYSEYEKQISPYLKKAFRRFSRSKVDKLEENKIEV